MLFLSQTHNHRFELTSGPLRFLGSSTGPLDGAEHSSEEVHAGHKLSL